MLFNYIWQYQNLSPDAARERFVSVLQQQCDLYSSAWDYAPEYRIESVGNVLIGQVFHDDGIKDWSGWQSYDSAGLAWNGVSESYLGAKLDEHQVLDIVDTLEKTPERLASWDGHYSVVSWNTLKRSVSMTMGAIGAPTAWHTDGPCGWAAGSHAQPLMELVGRSKVLHSASANLYVAYGYLVGKSSLFEHVHRLSSRQQVVLSAHSKPRITDYLAPSAILNSDDTAYKFSERAECCAQVLRERVGRQLAHSSQPKVLLTGGRDSRAIAAAAHAAGFRGLATTGGDTESTDFRIAKDVAHALGLSHQHSGPRLAVDDLLDKGSLLKLWTQMSEGIETLRHALAYPRYFERTSPVLQHSYQSLHGLGGEIGRGYYYGHHPADELNSNNLELAHQLICRRMDAGVKLGQEARALLEETFDQTDRDLSDLDPSVAQWLDYFYWQNRVLHWGSDMLTVKSPIYHMWTPLNSASYANHVWRLTPDEKRSNHFIETITNILSPDLASIAYDHDVVIPARPQNFNRLRKMKRVIRRNLSRWLGREARTSADTSIQQLWQGLLLDDSQPAWLAYIGKAKVEKLIRVQPNADLLWNLATIELLHKNM